MLQLITFSTLNGVLYGMLLFMMASGLTPIFSMMGVLNFAHASFYMLGAYFGFEISRRVAFWPGLVLAPLMVGVIGALLERYGLRRLHRRGHVSELLFTFGLAFVIEELVQMVWGKLPVDYRVPPPARLPGLSPVRHHLSGLSRVHAAHSRGDVRSAARRADPHPRRPHHSSRADPSGHGGDAHDVPKIFMLVFGAGAALAGLAGVIAGCASAFSRARAWREFWRDKAAPVSLFASGFGTTKVWPGSIGLGSRGWFGLAAKRGPGAQVESENLLRLPDAAQGMAAKRLETAVAVRHRGHEFSRG